MWLNKTDGKIITNPEAITIGNVQYPSSIFSKWSESELNNINLFTITEDSRPNRRYYDYSEILDADTVHLNISTIVKSIEAVQGYMLVDLENVASGKFNEATSGYTPGEMSSWSELEADAIQHQTTTLLSGMLFDEALIAGISLDELATRVLFNANLLKQAKSFISGTRKKKSLEIMALTTVASCELYENTPYNYTITAQDVLDDIEGVLVEGQVVPRIENKVRDW